MGKIPLTAALKIRDHGETPLNELRRNAAQDFPSMELGTSILPVLPEKNMVGYCSYIVASGRKNSGIILNLCCDQFCFVGDSRW